MAPTPMSMSEHVEAERRSRLAGPSDPASAGASVRHDWNVTPKEARSIQADLCRTVIRQDRLGSVRLIAGVDVGFKPGEAIARAAVAVLKLPDLQLCDAAVADRPVTFPYVPGLLSFREIPVLLDALGKLREPPDLILCDGQGLAHPRRFGIACHLGVLTGIPTIGAAKSRLIGSHRPLGPRKGQYALLKDGDEVIGLVLRTRTGVKPIYVSTGHKVSLQTARRLVLACVTRYRLPETTRVAHRLASGGR